MDIPTDKGYYSDTISHDSAADVGSNELDVEGDTGDQAGVFQFSLRTLLFATALLSIPLTLLHWLGAYFFVPILFSIGLVVLCGGVYRPQTPKRLLIAASLAIPAGFAVAFFFVMFTFRLGGAGALITHTLINLGVCLTLGLIKCPRAIFASVLCLAAIVPYTIRIFEIQHVRERYEQMLADHPLESLETRLSFETERDGMDAEVSQASLQLSPAVANRLSDQEQRYGGNREWTLTELHENYSTHFAAAAGFGFVRMRRIYPEDLNPEPIELVQLPMTVSGTLLGEDEAEKVGTLHGFVSENYLSRDKIGYVQDREHVAGFLSHNPSSLTARISEYKHYGEEMTPARWQITRLELISLLRHSPPRVYLSETLPAMDELETLKHRALSEFELSSLDTLREQEDVVVEVEDDRIRMVGALRASQDCLKCHQGQPGKVLGAFSYELARLAN